MLKNIGQHIIEKSQNHRDRTAIRFKQNKWIKLSYSEFADRIIALSCGLLKYGITKGDRIGIFSHNSPEWLIADYAIMSIGAVTVPLYATTAKEHVIKIINNSQLKILFVGDLSQLQLIDEVASSCSRLEMVVTMGGTGNTQNVNTIEFLNLLVIDYAPFIDQINRLKEQMQSNDLATIIYTSGTTGEPKGVMLTHDNFRNQHSTLDDRFNVSPEDISLCFLPLSHVYERSWSMYLFSMGACNTVLADPKNVIEALSEVKPSVMVSAPRLYEKIHAAILTQVSKASVMRQKIFYWSLKAGKRYWTKRYTDDPISFRDQISYYFANKIVLMKLRKILGGYKNFLSSGGAPLDQSVEEFFFCLGLLICQGYGLTETSPMLTCNAPSSFKFGTVGRPIDDVLIKISKQGEILAAGPNVTQGYFRNEQATKEALCFEEGRSWFHTGDIGHLDSDGYLVITDRMKDLIITAGGKNIAPQRIETLVGKDYYIDQLVVFGDRKKYITAIIVPAMENLIHYAEEKGIKFNSESELISLPEIIEFYTQRIEQNSKDLSQYEKIQKFSLIEGPFDQEKDEITPTLKVRRKIIRENYKDLINSMYSD